MTTLLKSIFILFLGLACLDSISGQAIEIPPVVSIASYAQQEVDTVIYVGPDIPTSNPNRVLTVNGYANLQQDLVKFKEMDSSFLKHISVHIPSQPSGSVKRVIFSPTGNFASDTADSRTIYDAASKAVSMAYIAAVAPTPLEGAQNAFTPTILLILGPRDGAPADAAWAKDGYAHLNAALGALYALYVPRDIRLVRPNRAKKYTTLYLALPEAKAKWVTDNAQSIEQARIYTRDICGGDPETMNPSEMLNYIKNVVKYDGANVVMSTSDITEEEYPLVAAVNRASKNITRYIGKIVKLKYNTNIQTNQATKSLYFVGSGVTLDTGGLDLKVSNTMPGHHRDKCGAAAVIGFFKMLERNPNLNIKASATLAILRNNIGAESFSTDEIIKAKSGKRIKIGYTDAEARLFLADLLYEQIMESEADNVADKQFFAIGSFTEHVTRMYKFIMGAIQNGVSKRDGALDDLQKSSELLADPIEITAIRWEDYDANRGPLETEDYRNSSPEPSLGIPRSSQIAAAFLIQASRMDEHGLSTSRPLKFISMDVTGSAGNGDTVPTASPLNTLAAHYLITP